jgi:two-component system cell cycle sensor histidine kinase/response regulator CckA
MNEVGPNRAEATAAAGRRRARSLPTRSGQSQDVDRPIAGRRATERALEASEARFAAAFNGSGVMMLITRLSDGGHIVDVNDAFIRMSGLTKEQVLGRTAAELGLFRDVADRERLIGELARSGHVRNVEIPVRTPQGEETFGLFSADVIDLEGEPHAIVTVVDLTERVKAAEHLRASENRYRSLFEQIVDGVVVLDDDARIVDLNSAMAGLMGRTAEQVRGSIWTDYVEPENLAAVPFRRPAFAAGNPDVFERCLVRPDGTISELEIHARRYSGGFMIGIARDIGARKAADRERARLIEVIEQSSDATLIVDRAGSIVYMNPAMERLRGCCRDDAIGRPVSELEWDLKPEPIDPTVFDTAAREGSWSGEIKGWRADGSASVQSVSITAVRDEAGLVDNLVVVQRDVTRERELEDMLRQSQKMEAVGRLAGGVAHDFNNLLTAIAGFNELARNEAEPDSDLAGYLAEIKASTDRAGKLTRQLLTFGRRAVLAPEILDLNHVVADIAPMLRRVIGEDIELILEAEPDLRAIKADSGQLEQVIVNLAVNARDAMPVGGRITITTSNVSLEATETEASATGAVPRDSVRLAMTDTGSGIDPSIMDLIWEPFFTTKPPGAGAGLGLATVFGIVRQAGGHLHVESQPGAGATFMVDLPAVIGDASGDAAAIREAVLPRSPSGHETILVVEDEPAVLGFASRLLERSGYRVLRARDGEQAIKTSRRHQGPIDLLFSDIVMPGMSGRDAASAIKAVRPDIKLLFTSGYSEQTNVRRGGRSRLRFLAKPYSGEDLLSAVRAAMLDRAAG